MHHHSTRVKMAERAVSRQLENLLMLHNTILDCLRAVEDVEDESTFLLRARVQDFKSNGVVGSLSGAVFGAAFENSS